MKRALILFIDGVGVGDVDPARNAFTARPPANINRLIDNHAATLAPLDASLGVPGLPQSGTGHYTLFTGHNGALQFGRHYGPYVPTALREPLRRDNLLTRAQRNGKRIAFANAYPEELLKQALTADGIKPIGPLRAGPPLVAAGAGVLTRHTRALELGDAVSSEITNEAWREKLQRSSLPTIDGRTAGHNLARIANQHDLTLFAHYDTDRAGHEQDLQAAIAALQLVDDFVGGVVERIDPDVVVFLVSDHGNLEDCTIGHTMNPAFGLVIGAEHDAWARRLTSIADLAPSIADLLA